MCQLCHGEHEMLNMGEMEGYYTVKGGPGGGIGVFLQREGCGISANVR